MPASAAARAARPHRAGPRLDVPAREHDRGGAQQEHDHDRRAADGAAPPARPTRPGTSRRSRRRSRARRDRDRPCRAARTRSPTPSAPNTACPLLVPSATCGGNPAASSAGSDTRPPPPAIASTSPGEERRDDEQRDHGGRRHRARLARARRQKKFASRGPVRRTSARTFSIVDPAAAEVAGGRVAGWKSDGQMARGTSPIRALAGLFLAASLGCGLFDFDVDLAQQTFTLDFGQQAGTMPAIACDASAGACGSARAVRRHHDRGHPVDRRRHAGLRRREPAVLRAGQRARRADGGRPAGRRLQQQGRAARAVVREAGRRRLHDPEPTR